MKIESDIIPTTELCAPERPTNLQAGLENLADLAKRVDALSDTLDRLSELAEKNTRQSVKRLKAELDGFEPSVTILGQVKSGKTFLINAMAGWSDLLPSDVNPWTSVVTSLHLTPGRTKKETGARFQFMTEDEWDRLLTKGGRMGELAGRAGADNELENLRQQVEAIREKSQARLGRNFELLMGQEHEYGYFDKNLLERYICLGDEFDHAEDAKSDNYVEQGRFADITRSADLYLNCQTIPFRMCLRDTPGVNDTFMMREQITIQAIRDSRICVVVLSAGQALTSVDMGLIRLISNLKSREVIIFVNRIDELPDPRTQVAEIEQSIRQTLKDHHGPHDAEIVFGSAYWANRVLCGEIEEMRPNGSKVLLEWAEARLKADDSNHSASNMVWELSGIPALLKAISQRVVRNLGNPCLSEIANSAQTIVKSQQAARMVRVGGRKADLPLNPAEVLAKFQQIEKERLDALKADLVGHIKEYQIRADRTHLTFIDRATHSLIKHLETHGDQTVWEYDPSALRILLRSAYSLLGSRTRAAAKKHYEQAVCEIAELMYRGFGDAVEDIPLSIPDTPATPSPIVLGQTIALDFDNGWWVSWWHRKRGYDAFAEKFRKLIVSETEQFLVQIKSEQTSEIHDQIVTKLQAEFEKFRSIITDLSENATGKTDLIDEINGEGERRRREGLDDLLTSLQQFAE
ncbi:MAG: hypothetical protein GY945_16850 [Rhodobacteraceae bacterium]|nr:hypothetical protein [Paracoccaceae bacterium]